MQVLRSGPFSSFSNPVSLEIGSDSEPVRLPGIVVLRQTARVMPMKSSYELAMERLAKADPKSTQPLNAGQKARLAEIDRVYQGKLAEREIFLKQRLDQALADQKAEDADKIRKELVSEKARLEEEREAEKDRVRSQ